MSEFISSYAYQSPSPQGEIVFFGPMELDETCTEFPPSFPDDFEPLPLDEDAGEDAGEPTSATAKFYTDKNRAVIPTAVAERSFEVNDGPIFSRAAGVDPYGAGPGNDVQSPLADSNSILKILWVRQHIPRLALSIFRRPDVTAHKRLANEDLSISFLFQESPYTQTNATTGSQFITCYGRAITPGTKVQLVIELMDNDKFHPNHWSRLPDVATYTHWNEARSWALVAEWQDESGIRRHKYIFSETPLAKRLGHDIPGAFDAYAQALAVVRHVKQEKMDRANPDHPRFLYDYGTMSIKVQSYDHMNQIMTYTDQTSTGAHALSPTKRSQRDIIADLRAAGLNAGGPWQRYDRIHSYNRFPRGACDSCHFLNIASRNLQGGRSIDTPIDKVQACQRMDDLPNLCRCCYDLGRVCSWTAKIHDVRLDHPIITAIRPADGYERISIMSELTRDVRTLNVSDYETRREQY